MNTDANVNEPAAMPREKSPPIASLIIGWAAAAVSLVFVPILFGAVAVILGYVVKKKYQRDVAGFSLMVGGIACAILGILIGILTNL
ncbi:hypothetical protein OMP38_22600 [Cohnella ginsengisoli]|uniref:DUF4190 domain-containing protein n=1 Tax=Cohnella ginsengisoli TaxID=425004 RepID=A0A9X4KNK7_9BACL|nr:hypothetical protein [Cohnella ginsengisoli]MDG0793322.1 hypothetical protein [Cohnella ginsengisoli]